MTPLPDIPEVEPPRTVGSVPHTLSTAIGAAEDARAGDWQTTRVEAPHWAATGPVVPKWQPREGMSGKPRPEMATGVQGLTLVHVRAQLEQLQETFSCYFESYRGLKSSS